MHAPRRTVVASAKAFTLIEMMVSVSIFLVVMVIILGALLSIIDGNKKTQAINSVSNNLNSAIESMVRDIKTGYGYKCGVATPSVIDPDAASGCNATNAENSISFISTISGLPRPVQYWLELDELTGRYGIKKFFCPANISDPATQCTQGTITNFKEQFVTAPDINITKLEFYTKVPPLGQDQPAVFIVIKGTAYINKTQSSDFSIQTFVSQRLLNI